MITMSRNELTRLPLRAQQKAMPVIGFLSGVSPETYTTFVDAFRSGLKDAGFLEGAKRGDPVSLGGGSP